MAARSPRRDFCTRTKGWISTPVGAGKTVAPPGVCARPRHPRRRLWRNDLRQEWRRPRHGTPGSPRLQEPRRPVAVTARRSPGCALTTTGGCSQTAGGSPSRASSQGRGPEAGLLVCSGGKFCLEHGGVRSGRDGPTGRSVLSDVLDSPSAEKGGGEEPPVPRVLGDGRLGLRAGCYAAAGSASSGRWRSARSDSARWVASSTVLSRGWSNTKASR